MTSDFSTEFEFGEKPRSRISKWIFGPLLSTVNISVFKFSLGQELSCICGHTERKVSLMSGWGLESFLALQLLTNQ